MVYLFAESHEERLVLAENLRSFAKSYYNTLTCVVVDPLDFPDLPAKLGLEPGRYPAGSVHQLSKQRIFPYPYARGISPKELQAWGLDVWQGKVKPWKPRSGPGGKKKRKQKTTKTTGRKKKNKAANSGKENTEKVLKGLGFQNNAGIGIRVGGRDEL
jgi:protein disulfide-isomerase A1